MSRLASGVAMNPFGIEEVAPAEVKARLDKGDGIVLLDVREDDEVAMASLNGALHIPLGDVPYRLAEIPKEKDLIVFCHHGNRSLMGAYQLKRKGFPRVFSMAGGIDLWSQQVDPDVPQYE
jgi:adenylyltransferase/sulfurtransferase